MAGVRLQFGVYQSDFLGLVVVQFFHHMRPVNHTIVGQGCRGMRHLQWGISVIALAYADGNHFGWVPFLVLGDFLKRSFFHSFDGNMPLLSLGKSMPVI